MTAGTEIRTFREPLYLCGEQPPCGAAVPASGRETHEAWHRDHRTLVQLVERLGTPVEHELQGDVDDGTVPLRQWADVDEGSEVGDVDDWGDPVEVPADLVDEAKGDPVVEPAAWLQAQDAGEGQGAELRRRFGG